MRRALKVGLVAAVLACSTLVLVEVRAAGKSSVPAEVAQAADHFRAAVNAKDVKKVASLYAEDAVLLPPNSETIRGRAGIEDYWRNMIDQEFTVASTKSIDAFVSGKLAYETGNYEISLKLPSGVTITDKGKYMNVMRRGSDGHWSLAYDIWNSSLPVPGSSK